MFKIILLKGQSTYGALRSHINHLAMAFQSLECHPVIVDLMDSDWVASFNQALSGDGLEAIISFNGIGCDLKLPSVVNENSISFFDHFQVPLFSLYVDHPSDHLARLDLQITNYIPTFLDKSHVDYVKDYYGKDKFQMIAMLLPGGSISPNCTIETTYEEYVKKRTIPLMFTGSFRGEPIRPWNQYPSTICKILDFTADYILSDDYISVLDGINYTIELLNLSLGDKMARKMKLFASLLHNYVHSYRRYTLFKTLCEHEIPIVVYGQGWESWVEKWPSISLQKEGTIDETLDNLHQARIILNSNTHFVHGAHDRVFTAMMNGAVVVSDHSTCYDKFFINGKELLLFQWSSLSQLPAALDHLIHHPEITWEMSKAAYENAIQNHGWNNRAIELIDMIQLRKTLLNISI